MLSKFSGTRSSSATEISKVVSRCSTRSRIPIESIIPLCRRRSVSPRFCFLTAGKLPEMKFLIDVIVVCRGMNIFYSIAHPLYGKGAASILNGLRSRRRRILFRTVNCRGLRSLKSSWPDRGTGGGPHPGGLSKERMVCFPVP